MRLCALIAVCLLALLSLSTAEDQSEICACTRNFELVCGSDGITYPNPCELNCSARRAARHGSPLTLVKAGPC
ncbi:serine protease inhibitor dipetalogastin-like [Drosophila mojavensis]|uniref:serine protease inhibitor dipetalogastin-like n=1 Tax=Drosophila mojavensis TaxID=7230 RepID=UPI00017C8DED|nr:serine protease inhibitor dipetalogastin-like [Drosophila mojavensis]